MQGRNFMQHSVGKVGEEKKKKKKTYKKASTEIWLHCINMLQNVIDEEATPQQIRASQFGVIHSLPKARNEYIYFRNETAVEDNEVKRWLYMSQYVQ